jgi:methyl-accepting chemotaxis protein
LQSFSGIAQVITSLDSNSERARQLSTKLVELSQAGRKTLDNSTRQITLITEQTTKIANMVKTLDDIASQTNVLAINAAIEAAHADNSGRGFAVVSDEIRKLAGASGTDSKEIAGSLKGIVLSAASAKKAAMEAEKSFVDINSYICEVADFVVQIAKELKVLDSESSEMQSLMRSFSNGFADLQNNYTMVCDQNKIISGRMGDVKSVSSDVTVSMQRISGNVQDLKKVVENVDQLSARISDVSKELSIRCDWFKM